MKLSTNGLRKFDALMVKINPDPTAGLSLRGKVALGVVAACAFFAVVTWGIV